MPAFVKTKEDERLWQKAKKLAEEEGHKEDWAYITGIFKKMKGGKVASRVVLRWKLSEDAKVNPGGRAEAKGVESEDFPRKTIEKGIKVEMEHTKDRNLAEKIVLDHLAESPDYYEALEKMEEDLTHETVPADSV